MKKNISMLFVSMAFGILMVADILLFVALGYANPLPWILLIAVAVIPYFSNAIECRKFVTWKPAYSVGIESIDNEHKKLLSLINTLQTAAHYRTGEEFEKKALNELVDYTLYHFKREEEMMEQHDFPGLAEHKREHDAMVAKVESFVAEYSDRGIDVLEDISTYLKNWLIKHINGTDKQYCSLLYGER